MKRPLMYAAGGFVLGEVCLLLPAVVGIGIPVILTAGVCYLWMQNSGRSLLWWILPLFCVLGMLRFSWDQSLTAQYEQVGEMVCGKDVQLEGTVGKISSGEKTDSLQLGQVIVRVQGAEYKFGDVLVYVDGDENVGLEGMRIAVAGRLERFDKPGNPGQFDYGAYYHSMGIEGRMFGESLWILGDDHSPYLETIRQLKERAAGILREICTDKDGGIFQAVVLGDKGELQDFIRELYQKNGIAHLLAVSGLHISMIGLSFYHLLRKVGLGFTKAGATAIMVTVSYGVMIGGTASVVRAVVMVCFQLWAEKLGRTYDMLSAMAFAALALLIHRPTLLFRAGFQLSFGAVLAIGAWKPLIEWWIEAEKQWEKTLLLSLAIQVVTYPVTLWHFFEYPVYSVILNLIVIPLMGYVLASGLMGIGIGGFWKNGGRFAIGTGHYVLVFYEWLCRNFQKLPGAVQVIGRPGMWQVAVYGGFWSVFLIVLYRKKCREKLGGTKRGRRVFLTAAVLAWMMFLTPVPAAGLSAAFLDVGQGDGICLRTGEVTILVDGGSSDQKKVGEQVLEPFLKSQGISLVDYAIVSHADQDHISGLTYLLENDCGITIGSLILPWQGRGDEAYENLKGLAEAVGTKIYWMKTGNQIQVEKLTVRCLYAGENLSSLERNNHSLMLEVKYGNCGIVLTGDMSAEGERQWLAQTEQYDLAGAIQILKVAHHGSGYSTSEEFLKKIQPEIAVISCGEENTYGHPHEETLERLEAVGSAVMVTKECGAVMVEVGKEVKVYGYGQMMGCKECKR